MKQYPSITGPSKAPRQSCYGFVKYDGSNLRFKWSKKKGWHLFGTRKQLFNESSTWFGPAIPLFLNQYADLIEEVVTKDKLFHGIRNVVVFCEYFGAKSFAGWHDIENDPNKMLVLFDVNTTKHGLIGPKEFIENADQSNHA